MTINEKIHKLRIKKNMSQAELAYKSGYSINNIIRFESNGTTISGYELLQIVKAFDLKLSDFQRI